jgi:RNA polymerase sigma factor (sigma-70 family)
MPSRPTRRGTRPSAFYREFVPTLVAFLMWQGAAFAEAADIAQETMIAAHQHWTTIRVPAAWARRVASRALARRIARVEEDPVDDLPQANPLLPEQSGLSDWEQRHDILRLLALLPPRQRQVMAWTLDGYAPAETAEELQISPDTVRANLHKARRSLARHLAAQGGGEPR